MIKLSQGELAIVQSIFRPYKDEFEVLVFGSRYSGKTHEHSDLDIAIKGKTPMDILSMAEIRDAFGQSDLPFRVDIVDFHRVSSEFQKVILENSISLWEASV